MILDIDFFDTQDCDKLAIRSQQTWGEAKKNGVFDLEMANVEITTKKGTKVKKDVHTYSFVLMFDQCLTL